MALARVRVRGSTDVVERGLKAAIAWLGFCALPLAACFGADAGNTDSDAGGPPPDDAGMSESGVSPTRALGELSDDELRAYCEWEIRQEGAGFQMQCSETHFARVGEVILGECLKAFEWPPTCTATVLDAEACLLAALREPCDPDAPRRRQACAWVDPCMATEPD